MEKRIKTKINKYFINFKQSLDEKISELNLSAKATAELRQYIYNFPELNIGKDDFAKRKRTKNTIPAYERCNAKRANGEQCTRKKKGENSLCGTHIKGTPHGTIEKKENEPAIEKIEVWTEDIKGIIYYIDKNHNVYNNQDIFEMKVNPRKIAKWAADEDGNIFIPKLNN